MLVSLVRRDAPPDARPAFLFSTTGLKYYFGRPLDYQPETGILQRLGGVAVLRWLCCV